MYTTWTMADVSKGPAECNPQLWSGPRLMCMADKGPIQCCIKEFYVILWVTNAECMQGMRKQEYELVTMRSFFFFLLLFCPRQSSMAENSDTDNYTIRSLFRQDSLNQTTGF